jgi:hypothetical protein
MVQICYAIFDNCEVSVHTISESEYTNVTRNIGSVSGPGESRFPALRPLSILAVNQQNPLTKAIQMVLSQISHTRHRIESRSLYDMRIVEDSRDLLLLPPL